MREVEREHRLAVPGTKGQRLGSVGADWGHVVHPAAFGNPADGSPFSRMFLGSKCPIHKLLFNCLDHLLIAACVPALCSPES